MNKTIIIMPEIKVIMNYKFLQLSKLLSKLSTYETTDNRQTAKQDWATKMKVNHGINPTEVRYIVWGRTIWG